MIVALVALHSSPQMVFPGGTETALMLMRWIHFIAGITWVGLLYFFNLVNVPFHAGARRQAKRIVVIRNSCRVHCGGSAGAPW